MPILGYTKHLLDAEGNTLQPTCEGGSEPQRCLDTPLNKCTGTKIFSPFFPSGRSLCKQGPIGWHSFRHSYSTLLRSLQVDLKVQQELLWHSDIRTTMNIYAQAARCHAGGQQQSRRNDSSE